MRKANREPELKLVMPVSCADLDWFEHLLADVEQRIAKLAVSSGDECPVPECNSGYLTDGLGPV